MEIVRIAGGDYERYQELLLKKEALKKEAFQAGNAFTREFGEMIILIYSENIKAISLHKKLSIIQLAANHGTQISEDDIQRELEKLLSPYYDELRKKKAELEAVQSGGEVSHVQLIKIKKIYRSIAKLIHPDICPLTQENETLHELWYTVLTAYECNDLETLEEAEVLVKKVLEENGFDSVGIVIPDIAKKIEKVEKDIEQITSTTPYTLRELMRDPQAIKERKEEYKKELERIGGLVREYEKMIEEMQGNYGNGKNNSADS